jgi:hypothetical protein
VESGGVFTEISSERAEYFTMEPMIEAASAQSGCDHERMRERFPIVLSTAARSQPKPRDVMWERITRTREANAMSDASENAERPPGLGVGQQGGEEGESEEVKGRARATERDEGDRSGEGGSFMMPAGLDGGEQKRGAETSKELAEEGLN